MLIHHPEWHGVMGSADISRLDNPNCVQMIVTQMDCYRSTAENTSGYLSAEHFANGCIPLVFFRPLIDYHAKLIHTADLLNLDGLPVTVENMAGHKELAKPIGLRFGYWKHVAKFAVIKDQFFLN
jgi:hypothetical protein